MNDASRADVTIPGSDRITPIVSATGHPSAAVGSDGLGEAEVLSLLEETMTVSKRATLTGKVRVSTRTETYDDFAEVTLDRSVVNVTRVPIGRAIDASPEVRTEGDTTIVPVIEERPVVVKQLYLKEELHIRHHVEHELSRTPVQLRRQVAVVERLDANGQVVLDDSSRS